MDLPKIGLGRGVLSDVNEVLGKEWLVTNGLGGYASSTVLGVNTRKYHGLLVEIARVPESVSLEVPVFCQLDFPDRTEVESVVNWMIAKEIMSKPITYEKVVETKYLSKR